MERPREISAESLESRRVLLDAAALALKVEFPASIE